MSVKMELKGLVQVLAQGRWKVTKRPRGDARESREVRGHRLKLSEKNTK